VWLAVNQLNVRAAKFYEKSGFQRVGTKTMQVGSRLFADYVYELTL
jgi:ribosomal protein S18 acetylase RimI-like enzyme